VSTDLQLVAIEGEVDPGTTVDLHPDQSLGIGRSSRGLRLPDPLVSIHHARIDYELKRGYVVTDLDSATGTWVDEECIENASRPIGVGTRLRFGETTFEVRIRRRYPVWVSVVMGLTLLFGVASLGLSTWIRSWPTPAPALQWKEPVRQGSKSTDVVEIPARYARVRGLDIAKLKIRRVTDYDYDGIDEVWLRDGERAEHVITFAPDGSVVDLGELPVGCHDQSVAAPGSAAEGFPALDCENIHYLMVDGRYRLQGHDGVVVWVVPRKTRDDDEAAGDAPGHGADEQADEPSVEPPPPGRSALRLVLKDSARLAGFLAERGVTEPVHYIVCEDAFPGLRAQVLTGSGELRTLSPGCLGKLRLTEPTAGKPIAVATTAWGREALLDDLRTFYSGTDDGLFLGADDKELIEEVSVSPGFMRGDVKLRADHGAVFVDPIPKDHKLPGTRRPIPKDQRVEVAPPATTATVETKGVAEILAGGCTKLRVRTEEFLCTGLCSGPFLTVEEVGCGPAEQVLSVDYDGGIVDGSARGLDVRAVVETGEGGVLRARLGWRSSPEE